MADRPAGQLRRIGARRTARVEMDVGKVGATCPSHPSESSTLSTSSASSRIASRARVIASAARPEPVSAPIAPIADTACPAWSA
jgi:hypothetical protein